MLTLTEAMTRQLGPGHLTALPGSADILLSQHPEMSKQGRTDRQMCSLEHGWKCSYGQHEAMCLRQDES